MDRNRVTYATVPPGSQYVEGVLPVVSPNYDIILDRRRTWWWEPGPVDSCCFCCHLEGGIMVLAGLKTAVNAILLLLLVLAYHVFLILTNAAQNATENALETAQDQYMTECESNPPTLSIDKCLQLEQKVDDLETSLIWQQVHLSGTISFNGYFTVFCLVVGLAGGVAGLWAGCGRNTFAAKLFFLSWPTSLALGIVSLIVKSIITYELNHHGYGAFDSTPSTFTIVKPVFYFYFIKPVFYFYFMKVSWSYYTVLKTRDTNASYSIESDIELRGIGE